MNYRHAYHAGNFADVVKHAALVRVLVHLREKESAFRVIDTHAGDGLYDLAGEEAGKTAEWRDGIGRLMSAPLAPAAHDLLAPYLAVVTEFNPGGALATYPGSPLIVRALLRPQDRLTACELEPKAARALRTGLGKDARAKMVEIDGWVALNAYVPPPERRGLVLIDPPFEAADEFARMAAALAAAHAKWTTGIFILWYPIKNRRETDAFARRLAASGIAKILRAELTLTAARDAHRLGGTGLIIVNPPWTLADELKTVLPALAGPFGRASAARVDWIAGEK